MKRVKVKNNLLGKCLVDKITGEVEDIVFVSKKDFISVKKKQFMRVFDNKELKQEIYKRVGDYIKYILLLTDYIEYNNIINFSLFQQDYGITDALLSKIRKRFEEHNIIRKNNKIWYLNPIIAYKGTEVDYELWELFKDKNKKFYGIISL